MPQNPIKSLELLRFAHLSRYVPRAPARSDLLSNPLHEVLGEHFTLEKFDEEDHTFVCALRDALADSQAVDDGVCVVRGIRCETHVHHIVQLS